MTRDDMAKLRPVAASMGLMLETASPRLSERGGVHFGSPDKRPAVRLATIEAAGALDIPFTTGLLIGIGETRRERIEAMLAIRELHAATATFRKSSSSRSAPSRARAWPRAR